MPVTPRNFHSPKAAKLAKKVMDLTQRYGSMLPSMTDEEIMGGKKRKAKVMNREDISRIPGGIEGGEL